MRSEKFLKNIADLEKKKLSYDREFKKLVNDFVELVEADESVDVDSNRDVVDLILRGDIQKNADTDEAKLKLYGDIESMYIGLCETAYVIDRNNNNIHIDKVDYDLSPKEMVSIKKGAQESLRNDPHIELRDGSKTTFSILYSAHELVSDGSDMMKRDTAEQQIKIETVKVMMCNTNGVTPESFDEFMVAVADETTKNIGVPGVTHQSIHKKFEHLLKKVENWDGIEPVYQSELLKVYEEEVGRIESSRTGREQGHELYLAFKESGLRAFKHAHGLDRVNTQTIIDNSVARAKGEIIKKPSNLLAQMTKKVIKTEAEVSTPHVYVEKVIEVTPEIIVPEVVLDNVMDTMPVISVEPTEMKVIDEPTSEVIVPEIQKEFTNPEYEYQTLPFEEAPVEEFVSSDASLEDFVGIATPTNEATVTHKEAVLDRPRLDEVSEVKSLPGNTDILRSNNPDKIRLYKESHKYGRMVYLTNSNFEVLVKRIEDRTHLTYITAALNKVHMGGHSLDHEVMKIIYKHLDFFFAKEPSEEDFFKCLSVKDIPILISMLAIISSKASKDSKDIFVEVPRIYCTHDISHSIDLIKPIKINMSERFTELYDYNTYSDNHSKYKEAEFSDIYSAYYNSRECQIKKIEGADEFMKYSILYGTKTYWDICRIADRKSTEMALDILLDRLKLARDLEVNDISPYIDRMCDYIDGVTFNPDGLEVRRTAWMIGIRSEELRKLYPNIIEVANSVYSQNDLDDEVTVAIEEFKIILEINNKLTDLEKDNAVIMYKEMVPCIKRFTISPIDNEELGYDLLTSNYSEIRRGLESIPDDVFVTILNTHEAIESDLNKTSIPPVLYLSKDDIVGNIDVDSSIISKEHYITNIRSEFKNLDEVELNELIDSKVEARNRVATKMIKDGTCFCGSDKFMVSSVNLLFFSITRQ